jgi:hypothetical protein
VLRAFRIKIHNRGNRLEIKEGPDRRYIFDCTNTKAKTLRDDLRRYAISQHFRGRFFLATVEAASPRSESDGRTHGRTCRSAHPGRRPWQLVRGYFDGLPSLHRRDTARTLRARCGLLRPLRGARRGRIGSLCRRARCAHSWAHGKLRHRGKLRILPSTLLRGADQGCSWESRVSGFRLLPMLTSFPGRSVSWGFLPPLPEPGGTQNNRW